MGILIKPAQFLKVCLRHGPAGGRSVLIAADRIPYSSGRADSRIKSDKPAADCGATFCALLQQVEKKTNDS